MAQQILHRAIITGGSEAWNPANMDNLLLFLHAPWEGGNHPTSLADRAQNPGLTAGDPVETATDWSPAGSHPTQVTLSQRPTWEAGPLAGVGGSHYYDLDGSDDRWFVDLTMTEEAYVAAVVNRSTGNPKFLFHWGAVLGFSTLQCLAQTSATSIVGMRGDSGSGYGANGTWMTGGGIDRLNWHSSLTPGEIIADVDDSSVLSGTFGTPVAIASKTQQLQIGSRNGFSWDGEIGSLLFFSSKPSAGDIIQLNTWLDEVYT